VQDLPVCLDNGCIVGMVKVRAIFHWATGE